jgi:hemerythrin-like domain-containing protein
MIDFDKGRRRFVNAAGMVGAGLMLAGTNSRVVRAAEKHDEDSEKEVSAVEDLMREHGVIRRAILVYREAAVKLRAKPSDVDPDILRRTALLFRNFGEDYHEKKLEETHIFPTIKKAGGPAVAYVDT